MADRTDDAVPDEAGSEEVGSEEVATEGAPGASATRPSSTGLPKIGDVVADRYRIEREVGHGGMAVVYAATQLSGGNRQVALKWLFEGRSNRDERRRRFLREARVASAIQHPNVVRVYDAGEHRDGVYLVMELVAGESLTAYMQRGKLSPRDAVDLLMPALRGIALAHKQGVIHRDLKPDNLIVCKSSTRENLKPELKVLDFGLSKLIGPAVDSLHTLPGTLVGTPQYMAPEQADNRLGAVSERSDVYTLAVILYEAVAGKRPFESETLAGQLMKIAHEHPTPLREVADVPEEFADTVMWALARDPAERPNNIEEFALELERFGTVGFADSGRMSEAKGSVRPRKLSDRAPAPQSVRAPAGLPASVSPAPAQAAPAHGQEARPRATWLVGGALVLIASAGLAYQLARAPEASDAKPLAAPSAPASEVAAPTTAVIAAPPPPAAAPAHASDAGVAPSAVAPIPEAPIKRMRAAVRPTAEPAQEAMPPAPPPASKDEPPEAPRRPKRSPGVADPWDEER